MTLVELISRADKNIEVTLFDKDKKDIGSYKIPFIPQCEAVLSPPATLQYTPFEGACTVTKKIEKIAGKEKKCLLFPK